jgi:hypothetical protein
VDECKPLASGGMNFWEEQIKNEKRLKKTWGAKYGVELGTQKAGGALRTST